MTLAVTQGSLTVIQSSLQIDDEVNTAVKNIQRWWGTACGDIHSDKEVTKRTLKMTYSVGLYFMSFVFQVCAIITDLIQDAALMRKNVQTNQNTGGTEPNTVALYTSWLKDT